ncbi:unnamed protein product [Linum trigynum]|uniref:Uncharacterized protein n=1 Tax=Linum trigynum TaxID=586398 RepID=A0AAV2ET61_9ROSI
MEKAASGQRNNFIEGFAFDLVCDFISIWICRLVGFDFIEGEEKGKTSDSRPYRRPNASTLELTWQRCRRRRQKNSSGEDPLISFV